MKAIASKIAQRTPRSEMRMGRAAFKAFREDRFSYASEKKNPFSKGSDEAMQWRYGWELEFITFMFEPVRVPSDVFKRIKEMNQRFPF